MDISVARRAVLVVVCLVLFSTCGELETLFPSNGAYQVRTLVNGSSLEECSIIRSNDKIRPYFAVSVVNDPDLIGLLVYLQDSGGKIIGDKVQYTLLPYADEAALTEADLPKETEPEETGEPIPESDDEHQIRERSLADAKPAEKNTDIEIAVKSFAQELPYFPLPKDLEIGPYILVFEALGKKDTLSRMETDVFYVGNAEFNLKDISMYLPGLSGPQLISPGTVIMLETSLDYDSRLDPYVIWYNGKNVISEGSISDGAGKLLWKAPEQAGFHSLRLEALPFHLKRSAYTGLSREIALPVSPKAINQGHFFENNEGYTARNPLSAETAYPAATVTAGEETPPAYPAPELLQWYQFDGSLLSSLSTFTNEQTLLPVDKSHPRWMAAGQSYGLAIGPDDPYLLPPVHFLRKETDQGGGILLFHIRPLSEGIIFSAFFPLQSSSTEGVRMSMIKEGNVITLRLSATDTFIDLPVYLTLSAIEGFIPIAVEFYTRPYRMEAKISLDEYVQNKMGEIKLSGVLSGEGRFRLGGVMDKPILDKPINEAAPPAALPLEETFSDTIWDELAILSSTAPLQKESSKTAADAYEADRPVETDNAEARISLTDTDADNSVQEQETQEREAQ